jgi:RimJ/RimL family protein N-acetyltransferase
MEEAWYDRILADQGGKRASFAIEDLSDGVPSASPISATSTGWPIGTIRHRDRRRDATGSRGMDATKLTLVYGFEILNLDRIELRVIDDNARARHIYEKMGFVEEGRLRRAAFVEGAPADVIVMGFLREEFR